MLNASVKQKALDLNEAGFGVVAFQQSAPRASLKM